MILLEGCRTVHRFHRIVNKKWFEFNIKYDLASIREYASRGIYKYPNLICHTRVKIPGEKPTELDKVIDSLEGKIIYSTYFVQRNRGVRWQVRDIMLEEESRSIVDPAPTPVYLKYIIGDKEQHLRHAEDEPKENAEEKEEIVGLPYSIVPDIQPHSVAEEVEFTDEPNPEEEQDILDKKTMKPGFQHWMSDYECFEEELPESEEINEAEKENEESAPYYINYGTSDADVPVSEIPCGGCGALLHCQNPSIPGYVPKELFSPCTEDDLRAIVCQRCHFLKRYDTALSVNVDPEVYPKLMATIERKRALIILMVDMTDFPCSIWPGIFDLIGPNKSVVIVGNKIDLIPGDCPGWLNYAEKSLRSAIPEEIDVKHVGLISAKTGYGVESLITKLHNIWQTKGDVYLIGCTNVGKSTLFNALLHSDYCKAQASDVVQRATTSRWPGTTINLLKFPILRPSGWRLYLRTQRLIRQKQQQIEEQKLVNQSKKFLKHKFLNMPRIIERIGRTFRKVGQGHDDLFMSPKQKPTTIATSGGGLNENHPALRKTKWFYDTPGVVHPDQIIDLLTIEELMKVVSSDILAPETYSIRPHQTMFIGGIARLDVVDAEIFVRSIIYRPPKLPLLLCETVYADEIYNKLLGTEVLGVPCGGKTRLEKWPSLKPAPDIEFTGINPIEICCEIVLSNAGWISFVAKKDQKYKIRAWTPEARGIYRREVPLLAHAARLRKERIPHTPVYSMKTPYELQLQSRILQQ